jgi:hypothetical protein
VFEGDATFEGAIFNGWAEFSHVMFNGVAEFGKATFKSRGRFEGVTFNERASFYQTVFEGEAGFHVATFKSQAFFGGATFKDAAGFHGATFEDVGWFAYTTFEDLASFSQVTFQEGEFYAAAFEQAREFGPFIARRLNLERATFKQRVQIEVAAIALCGLQARFPAGVQLRLRWAQVVLDDADLAAPSILTGVPPFTDIDEEPFAKIWARLPPRQVRDGRPRLLSLRRADVAGLTVANVDLRACRFLGAHNLDKLRIEGDAIFGYTPRPWRWTTRQTLAEEHHWRNSRNTAQAGNSRPGRDWYPTHYRPPQWLAVEIVTSAQVAGLYRALRKGREDNKDEPGAADFYYGEMEMRRNARHEQARQEGLQSHWGTWAAARVEHGILWLYWLVSGYALRAWRALAAFAVLLVLFAALCTYGGGFASTSGTKGGAATSTTATSISPSPTQAQTSASGPVATRSTTSTSISGSQTPPATMSASVTTTSTPPDTSFGGALVYGARTVIGLGRDPQPPLSRWGDVLQILLRLIGPVLLGLAIFSIRGRVKR